MTDRPTNETTDQPKCDWCGRPIPEDTDNRDADDQPTWLVMTVSTGWVRVLSDGDFGKSDTDEAMVCEECCAMAEQAIQEVIDKRRR